MSYIRQAISKAVQATIDGFNDGLDYDALRAPRSDDFVYQFLPLTLGAPPRDNEQYKDFFFSVLKPLFSKFHLKPKTLLIDEESRRAAFYGEVDTESPFGSQSLELVMMLSFTGDGEKIRRIDEFFDSAVYSAFFARVQEQQEAAGNV